VRRVTTAFCLSRAGKIARVSFAIFDRGVIIALVQLLIRIRQFEIPLMSRKFIAAYDGVVSLRKFRAAVTSVLPSVTNLVPSRIRARRAWLELSIAKIASGCIGNVSGIFYSNAQSRGVVKSESEKRKSGSITRRCYEKPGT